MTLAADIAGDYAYFDGTETVTLKNNAGTALASSVTGLERTINFKEEITAALALQPNDIVLHLWVDTLSGVSPAKGNIITRADGTDWLIVSTQFLTLEQRWRCFCRKAVTES